MEWWRCLFVYLCRYVVANLGSYTARDVRCVLIDRGVKLCRYVVSAVSVC